MRKATMVLLASVAFLVIGSANDLPVLRGSVAHAGRCGCPLGRRHVRGMERCTYFFCTNGSQCTSISQESFKCHRSDEFINEWLTKHRCRSGYQVQTGTWYESLEKAQMAKQNQCKSGIKVSYARTASPKKEITGMDYDKMVCRPQATVTTSQKS